MKKPNLIVILTDQQRTDTMKVYGNDKIQTPNLNRLAEESFTFKNAYVSQSVCSPSRATILTGLYPHTSKVMACNVPLSADNSTIAELVSDEYLCAYYGKWHLGDEIFPQHGFTEWIGTEDSYRRFYSNPEFLSQLSDYHQFLIKNGFSPDSFSLGEKTFSRNMEANLEEPFTKASYLGDRADDFIRNIGDTPYILFVSYLEPHPPHTGPLNDLYDPSCLPTGPNFRICPPSNASLLNRVLAAYYMESKENGYDLRTEIGWRKVRAHYWGNVSLVDRSVGKIMKALKQSGHLERTIVVFTSDHGEMVGDHGILGKTVLYEEAIKVPLLIRIPELGMKQRIIPGNFSQIDLIPTLLDLMGEDLPDYLQGKSRASLFRGEETLKNNDVFLEWNQSDGHPRPGEAGINPEMSSPWRTIVSADRWKLNLSVHDECELYNLNLDPFEQVNLFNIPSNQKKINDLISRVHQWQLQTNDCIPIPEFQ